MAILTIMIPSTYYTGAGRPSLGLSAGEITYDTTQSVEVGQAGKLEVELRAAKAVLSNVSMEVSVAGSASNGAVATVSATVGGASPPPGVAPRTRGAEFTLPKLSPLARITGTYNFKLVNGSQGWFETRIIVRADELRRPIDQTFQIPTQG